MKNNDHSKKNLQKHFGEVLRQFRTDAKISQERLALDVGLDRTYISLLERGLRTPTLFTIYLLADRLDISAAKMVSNVDEFYQQ